MFSILSSLLSMNFTMSYKVYSPYLDRFDRLKSGTLSRLQDMAEEIPDTYLAFPLVNGSETVGWFVIVLYDNREYAQETLQTVFEVFATFFQSLIDKVTMTKALYQSDFENRLNIRILKLLSQLSTIFLTLS